MNARLALKCSLILLGLSYVWQEVGPATFTLLCFIVGMQEMQGILLVETMRRLQSLVIVARFLGGKDESEQD